MGTIDITHIVGDVLKDDLNTRKQIYSFLYEKLKIRLANHELLFILYKFITPSIKLIATIEEFRIWCALNAMSLYVYAPIKLSL